ncbi:MAG: Transcriptional activator of maltose regulon, MalT [Nitrospira sp.]|nr:MAG: Transcriptional activator of maltose regulon, MalT [Nitrospira sp.]
MAKRIPTLAKLTTPRLHAVLCRERLFTLLQDQCDHYPLIWVSGPPGSGKTSLIASYLTKRKHRTLWYHLDPGDADLAAFFYYLAQAAQGAAGRKKLRLPALTPEFMADVPGFTRRFMRELWSKLPLPAALVLDNYQELPIEAPLHKILPIALAEFPQGAALIAISRGDVPEPFTRELVHNGVAHVRWEDLQLTFEETASLAGSGSDIDEHTLRSLHAKANGWVAGTILMLEQMKTNQTWNTPIPSETKTDVFHYFAEQVFMRMDSSTQEVLMRIALLPWVTGPMADEVSEHSGAAQIIRDLYQRGLFVDRRADAQVRYRYHDLFRDFLLDRCHVHFDGETQHSLKRIAAQVAERHGQHDTAVALYAETTSWDDLSRLICELAEALLSQGRNQTLQGYVGQLPTAEREKRPWLLYWSGISRLVFDPINARTDLEHAYLLFEVSNQDIAGRLLASGGIIESYYGYGDDMAPTIAWGDRIHQLLQQHKGFPSLAIEARVLMNLQGLIFACPYHPLIQEIEQSLSRTLHALDDPATRVGVAVAFMNLMIWRGHLAQMHQTLHDLTAQSGQTALPPAHLVTWKVMEAHHAWATGNFSHATAAFDEALHIADTFGILVFRPLVLSCQLFLALVIGDHADGETRARMIFAENFRHSGLTIGQSQLQSAGVALLRGDGFAALAHASAALETLAPRCLPLFTCNCLMGLAKVLIELSQCEEARTRLGEALDLARAMRSPWLESMCLLTLAYTYFREGQIELVNTPLRTGLGIASRHDFVVLDFWWRPKVMAELLAHALEANIEVEYVRSIIRRRGLLAPFDGMKHWPYPVKITTLGRFEVMIDDVPLATTGKTQRKPLELLKYLCAAGPHGANQELIEEALWPDADGEAANQAFRTTLHRLRKLLRHEDAVQLTDRHASIDLSLVSLDHIGFERTAQSVDRTDTLALEQTLALYRGHFLQGEMAAWALPVRERLRARFLNLTEQLGALLEERDDMSNAALKYLHALEVEPVAEVMCRRVMMTYVRLGRRSEAISVYQRFSQALRTKLGVLPTPETISLYDTIAKP